MKNYWKPLAIINFIAIASITTISGYAQLSVDFTFIPNDDCSEIPVDFTSEVSGGAEPYSYNWSFGDGDQSALENLSHIYNAYGCETETYTVTLIVTDNDNNTERKSKQVTVKERPNPELEDLLNDPDFSNCANNPTPDDPEFTIEVNNITTNTSCVTEYGINWGDGTPPEIDLTSSDFPLLHTYEQLGAFDLVFTAESTNGCTGSTTYIVKNQSNPAVGIGSQGGTQGCAPQTIDFTLFYYELNSPGTIYDWDFDDGTTDQWSQDDAINNNGIYTHIFNNTSCLEENNQFVVEVTASNSCSSTSASVGGIKTWTKPQANFEVDPEYGCVNQTCFEFTNTTIEGYYGPECTTNTNYSWDFDNGETSSSVTPPCQEYDQTGTYSVTLTTNNACGVDSFTQQIFVDGPPTAGADASPTNGCADLDVYFSNESEGNNIVYTWSVNPGSGWQFINGTNSHSENPVIQFNSDGEFTVTLITSNQCGEDTETFTIVVIDKPEINLPPISGDCPPYQYVGNAIYEDNGSTITQYFWEVDTVAGWEFGTGSNENSENPTINFNAPGDYAVSVTATNACGETTVTSNVFNVGAAIQVEAGSDTIVCFESGSFQMNGDPPGGTWEGDHVTSGGTFSPDEIGDFQLKYFRGTGNCMTEDSLIVTVIENPVVDPGNDQDLCIDSEPINLTGSPSGGYWVGIGITDSITGSFSPETAGSGTHVITYYYTDPATTCSSSGSIDIIVSNLPVVSAGNDLVLCNQPVSEQLTGFSPQGGSWTGPHITSEGIFTPDGVGIFILIYHYTSEQTGCSNSDTLQIEVIDAESVYAGADTSVCLNSQVLNLSGEPSGGTWSGQHVTSYGLFNPDEAGSFTLTYSRGVGSCLTNDQLIITVAPLPEVDAGNDMSVCNNVGSISMSGTPIGGFWAGTGIIDPINGIFDPSIAVSGIYTLSYSYTDSTSGCSNFDQLVITVKEAPEVNALDTMICNHPVPEQLIAFPPGGTWSGQNVTPDGLYTPAGTGTYEVTYTYIASNGCSNIDTATVNVIDPDTTVNAGPDYTICANQTITISGTPPGGRWSGIDIMPDGYFNPSGPGNYVLTYNLGVGSCLTQDSTNVLVLSSPTTDFTFNNVCFGETTIFIDQSEGGGGGLLRHGTGILVRAQTQKTKTLPTPIQLLEYFL